MDITVYISPRPVKVQDLNNLRLKTTSRQKGFEIEMSWYSIKEMQKEITKLTILLFTFKRKEGTVCKADS